MARKWSGYGVHGSGFPLRRRPLVEKKLGCKILGGEVEPPGRHVWNLGRALRYPFENVNFGPEKPLPAKILAIKVL